jgi:hypothetical protein
MPPKKLWLNPRNFLPLTLRRAGLVLTAALCYKPLKIKILCEKRLLLATGK